MTNIAVYNKEGSPVGEIELNDAIFNVGINTSLMHQAVLVYLAAQRRGTHSTKTKGLVSGGGKKPWRQKGTGRARVGSSRNPVWRGGGVAFGPQPRSYKIDMPKKMRRLALLSALSAKAQNGDLLIFDDLNFEAPKTKEMAKVLENVSAQNALVILEKDNLNALLSARNLPGVMAATPNSLNTYIILLCDKLVLTKNALATLEEVLANA
ncbi:MAG: 50S ribosomal protein L4 [Bacillota bacterium]|jgi:large subunit ribosomal protein L4